MISIIIPTLNEEKRIAGTIAMLRNFTSEEYEIIVSDGGSSDKTVDIAKRQADSVLEWRDAARRQTIAEGRNLGAAKARGEYLVFIDADVTIPDINQFFAKALKLFDADKRLVALTVFLKVFPESATLADRFFFNALNLYFYIANTLFRAGVSAGEFQMMRADAFRKVGGYDQKMAAGEDIDMFSRLSRIGRTRVEADLHVLHSSRRAHSIGWPKLLLLWWANGIWTKMFKRSFSKVWKPVRE